MIHDPEANKVRRRHLSPSLYLAGLLAFIAVVPTPSDIVLTSCYLSQMAGGCLYFMCIRGDVTEIAHRVYNRKHTGDAQDASKKMDDSRLF
jgi:hypothetical protein